MTVGDVVECLAVCDRTAPLRLLMNLFPTTHTTHRAAQVGDRGLTPEAAVVLSRQASRCRRPRCVDGGK